jgi:bla regulator protein blaR1
MTHLGLSADVARALCLALLHFLWQGLALALLFAAALAVVRRAAARYVLGVAALALMLAAPVATFLVLRHPATAASTGGYAHAATVWLNENAASSAATLRNASHDALDPLSNEFPTLPANLETWLLEFWLAGVLLFAARAFGGFCLVERLRRHIPPVSAELEGMGRALERSLGLRRYVRYCECWHLDSPAVIGWLRPVVLLPVSALTGLEPSQLRAIIAHELAHIRRLDAFINVFQTGAEALLFYHPAVWWVNARIRAERENCCDDVAVAACGGVPEYARALLALEERARGTSPNFAMAAAGSSLRARVLQLLGLERRTSSARSLGLTAASLCLTLVLLAGTGLLGTAREFLSETAHQPAMTSQTSALESTGASRPSAPPSTARLQETFRRTLRSMRAERLARASNAVESPAAPSTPGESPSALEPQAASTASTAAAQSGDTAAQSGSAESSTSKESFIGGLNTLGLKNLTADELIALKVQGVTPDYIRQVRAAGLNPDVNELIAMKVQNVTPEYIRGLRSGGFNPTVDELIAMKVQQVTPEYIDAMKASGFNPSVNELIALKVQGVTPEYLSAMRAAGVKLTAEEAIAMKVQGVSPDYIHSFHALGIDPKSDELIALKVQGVTPEYVHSMQAAGVKPNTEDLIAMKVQGVTPDYIREMHSAGLTPTTDQFIAMRTQGVTPEYVKALEQAGLGKLSTNDYIAAKVMGITPEFVEKARSHGIQGITLNKLIALKQAGVF